MHVTRAILLAVICLWLTIATASAHFSPPLRPHLGGDADTDRTPLKSPPEIIRGVNLGGWLVLEPWITPSLFEPFINSSTPAVDEWTFTEVLGKEEAQAQLTKHWDTWLQQSELETLAQAGITHVRIPVGYWIVSIEPYEPYVEGGWFYLTRALKWCSDAGLKVLIDIHGLPGSQNGFDNSGRRGPIDWNDAPGTNILRSVYILSNLTEMLQPYTIEQGGPVHAIELVNEPFVIIDLPTIQSYYMQGYSIVRPGSQGQNSSAGLDVVIHDAFRLGSWSDFMPPPAYQNVYLDTHVYQVFDQGLLRMNSTQHLDYLCTNVAQSQAQAGQSLWIITGEWSLATTDCARWLNGFGRGARYDGTFDPSQPAIGACIGDAGNDFSNFTSEYLAYLRVFAETQMSVWESASPNSAGWYFWNFKTESAPQWNFLLGLQQGFIPNPVTQRTHTCENRPGRRHLQEGDAAEQRDSGERFEVDEAELASNLL